MTESFEKQLLKETEALPFVLNGQQTEQLFRYYELLVEKNKVMNLTAITEESEVVTKHFTDSLSIIKACTAENNAIFAETAGKTLIDIGTGAGFPGLVLKIAFPDLMVTLSDSLMKRLHFLDEVIQELGLKGISTLHGRAEDLGRDKKWRGQFDFAVSRAVANMAVLSEYDIPFVKKGGYFLAMKAGDVEEELKGAEKAIGILGGKTESIAHFHLPESDIERSIVVVRKCLETPGKYPRKAGTPAKNPLG